MIRGVLARFPHMTAPLLGCKDIREAERAEVGRQYVFGLPLDRREEPRSIECLRSS